jgi:Flp pilus assembly pilin Flp
VEDRGYDDEGGAPLAGYAVIAGGFALGVAAYATVFRRLGRRVPDQVPPWDVLLLGTATFKVARLLSKDKVTGFLRAPFTRRVAEGEASEVMDQSRGGPARRAVGDLLSCPFCVGAWVAAGLTGYYAWSPRPARLVCAGLSAVTMADWLQYAWTGTQQAVEG